MALLTTQEIFDRVAQHLANQRVQSAVKKHESSSVFGCAYRDGSGNSCAVGCLIPDSEYRPEFDDLEALKEVQARQPELFHTYHNKCPMSTGFHSMRHYSLFKSALKAGGVDVVVHADLLGRLQYVHDKMEFVFGAYEIIGLRDIAKSLGLKTDTIDQIERQLAEANK